MKQLAQAIVIAARLREESFDREGADIAIKSKVHVDFNQFYSVTLAAACEVASEQFNVDNQPVYLLLRNSWNESLEWAEAYLKSEMK